jgi:uncharacterized membrane protein required for colicin V production
LYDFIVFLIVVGVATAQAFRGFGHALYDIAALYVALTISHNLYLGLAARIHFTQAAAPNNAVSFAVLFVLCGAGLLVLAHVFHNIAGLSIDPMDAVVGALLGFFSGIIIAHAFVQFLVIHSGATLLGPLPAQIQNSMLSKEVYTFEGIKGIVARLKPGANP